MHFRGPTRLGAPAAAAAVALALATSGCAHSESAADRHISEMRETITKIEAEQDRINQRLNNELGVDEKSAKSPKRSAPPPASLRSVRSVQIGDGDDAASEAADPNDPNARPEIRLQGQPGASRPVRGKTVRRGEARVDTGDDVDPSRSSVLDPDAKKAYETALGQIHARQYDRGLEGLNAFLVHWPDHPYAENAMYWRGETYYAKGEYLRAAEQLEAVIARFPSGSKSPDALLKIGLCHDRLGSSERAKEYWARLKREYPRSDAAKKVPAEKTNDTRGPVGPKESR